MFVRVLLAIILLVGVMWFMSLYGKAPAEKRNSILKKGLLYFVAAALLLLVVTGRIPILFAAVSAVIPFIHRIMAFKGLFKIFGRFAGQQFGPTTLTTAWLIVEYDLAKRSLDGLITKGEFEGQKLSQLSETDLDLLLAEVSEDFQSKAAVNAYIIARRGAHHTQHNNDTSYDANTTMSTAQATEILGIEPNANKDEIKQAHKRLMQKMHPDRGGSSYLAAQINAAKDVLLNNHV